MMYTLLFLVNTILLVVAAGYVVGGWVMLRDALWPKILQPSLTTRICWLVVLVPLNVVAWAYFLWILLGTVEMWLGWQPAGISVLALTPERCSC